MHHDDKENSARIVRGVLIHVTYHLPLESGKFGRKPEPLVLATAFFRLDTDGTQPNLLSSRPFDETRCVEVQGKPGFVEGCARDFIAIRIHCERLEIETTRTIPRCLE